MKYLIEIQSVRRGTQACRDFLAFPKRLYPQGSCQNDQEECQQIQGEHLLSDYYHFQAFIGYKNGEVVIRGALSYPKSQADVVYLGYFESVDDQAIMQAFMDFIQKEARCQGVKQIVGPVQASFWLGYRMRLSHFEQASFTGEPYNLSYYPRLWEQAGFQLTHRYLSNMYQTIPSNKVDSRLAKRHQQFVDKGYQIVSPKPAEWERVILEVYELLSQLYQDFPVYQAISAEVFQQLFANYQKVIDFSMVKLAYYQDQLVGFFITFPDYQWDVLGKLSPAKLWRILKRHRKAERYIVMYIGSHPDHLGISSAMAYPVFLEIRRRKAQAIGALIHQGKVTANYVADLQDQRHQYGLYQMEIDKL